MTAVSHTQTQGSFGADRSGVGLGERIGLMARRLWPTKTAPNLAARTGKSVRAAELLLSRNTGVSGEALAGLLRSDVGFEVLSEVMGEARPTWWADMRRAARIADLERRADENRRLIEEIRAEG
jgi:hypothetical protein